MKRFWKGFIASTSASGGAWALGGRCALPWPGTDLPVTDGPSGPERRPIPGSSWSRLILSGAVAALRIAAADAAGAVPDRGDVEVVALERVAAVAMSLECVV